MEKWHYDLDLEADCSTVMRSALMAIGDMVYVSVGAGPAATLIIKDMDSRSVHSSSTLSNREAASQTN